MADTNTAEQSKPVEQRQFPSLSGEKAVEVEKRSADGAEGTKYIKTFRVVQDSARVSNAEKMRFSDAVLREALNRGLHPKAEVEFVGTEEVGVPRRGMRSFEVTFQVEVEPAITDDLPQETIVPANNPTKPTPDEASEQEPARNPDKTAPATPGETTE